MSKRPSPRKTRARAGTGKPRRKTAKRSTQRMPVKISRGRRGKSDREEGPAEWFLPEIESTYTRLESPAQAAARVVAPPAGVTRSGHAFRSALQPGESEAVLAAPDRGLWINRLSEYKQRKSVAATMRAAESACRLCRGAVRRRSRRGSCVSRPSTTHGRKCATACWP